ncbi:MAG: mandelate racemase/muconate lactonizing enzyme family protein [Pirellulaceae bacterium]
MAILPDSRALATRRSFLALAAAGLCTRPLWAKPKPAKGRQFEIADIRRTTVKVPFRETPARNMDREIPHWRYSEIFEVTLNSGRVGIGETLLFYTWGVTEDHDVQRAMGRNAAELMWDDSLGAGLQMALFDAVARTMDVPVHHLLGRQVHHETPLSWWNIDTSAEDMAAECKLAFDSGYMAYKTKGRPWFDLWRQMDAATKVVPADFKIDMDFNDTLLDAARAEPILARLSEYPQVDIFETPISQYLIDDNRRLCEVSDVAIAMHYGHPRADVQVRERLCDGFVVGGGASDLMTAGHFAGTNGMRFWLQLVGTSITAAWSLHFGAVLSHATWPAVNCHQLYVEPLTTEAIKVKEGVAQVPDGPGLGYELDRAAVERYQVAKPPRRPEPARLIETTWPNGRRMFIANNGQVNFMLTVAREGRMPFYEDGAETRLVPNDGSRAWKEKYQRARREPFMERARR